MSDSEQLRRAFEKLDADNSGEVAIQTMEHLFNEMGKNVSSDDLQSTLSRAMGKETSPTINFKEFVFLMSHIDKAFIQEDEMVMVFRYFDRDGDGYISPGELKDLLASMGEELSEGDVSEMISEADKDGDGRVSYEEFVNVMTPHGDKKMSRHESFRINSTTNNDKKVQDHRFSAVDKEDDQEIFLRVTPKIFNKDDRETKNFRDHAKRRKSCFLFGTTSKSHTLETDDLCALTDLRRPRSRSSCGSDRLSMDINNVSGGGKTSKKRLSLSASASFLRGLFARKGK